MTLTGLGLVRLNYFGMMTVIFSWCCTGKGVEFEPIIGRIIQLYRFYLDFVDTN